MPFWYCYWKLEHFTLYFSVSLLPLSMCFSVGAPWLNKDTVTSDGRLIFQQLLEQLFNKAPAGCCFHSYFPQVSSFSRKMVSKSVVNAF